MRAPTDALKIGTVSLAHMPTFSEWPARILSMKKTRVNVAFFGDDLTGTIDIKNIGLIEDNTQLIKYLLNKKIRNYKKAVLELERFQNVPGHLSIVNDVIQILYSNKST